MREVPDASPYPADSLLAELNRLGGAVVVSENVALFRLERPNPLPDQSGGYVADAIVFSDGMSILRWRTEPRGVEIYPTEQAMRDVRERSGRSHFVMTRTELLRMLPYDLVLRVMNLLASTPPPADAPAEIHRYYQDCEAMSIVLRAELLSRSASRGSG
jgi:hypothetical protein